MNRTGAALSGFLVVCSLASAVSLIGAAPVPSPIVLKPHQHEQAQFGYRPDYMPNVPSFDAQNRPYIRSRGADMHDTGCFQTLERGAWVQRPFAEAVKAACFGFESFQYGGGWYFSHAVFDDDGDMYSIAQVRTQNRKVHSLLLYSTDGGNSFQVYPLPVTGGVQKLNIELRNDCQPLPGPPLIAFMHRVKEHPSRWADYFRLQVLRPVKSAGRLIIPEPTVVTDKCIGGATHSGGASFATTIGGNTHFVWIEIADDAQAPGTPTFVGTYDHATGEVTEKVLVGYAPPVNDAHNTPGICADSEGYLHVVTGAHTFSFQHMKSAAPNDISGGWTQPVKLLGAEYSIDHGKQTTEGQQTYLGLVCDSHDTLHVVFRRRQKSSNDAYFPNKDYSALAYQRKPRNGAWEAPRVLVVPPIDGYSSYHHKLAIDRRDRLYLSYTYLSEGPRNPYRTMDGYYHFPAVLMSGDGGESWELAETKDFAAGIVGG